MEPMLTPFIENLKKIRLNEPQIPFVSNVTGTWITPNEATDPGYWARQLRNTVRFSDCLEELFNIPDQIYLEIGPGRTLSTITNQHPKKPHGVIALGSLRHPEESESDVAYILNTLGRLWLSGKRLDWTHFYASEKRQRISLPTYPFERKRYWLDPVEQKKNYLKFFTKPPVNQVQSAQNQAEPDQEVPESYLGPPRNDVERSLAAIWEGLLGVNNLSIYDNFFEIGDNFFEIGGSSLIALSLFAQINKTFGENLPLATLFEAPTIEQLANILRTEVWTAPWTTLVKIQSGASKPPIYFIHAAGGNLLIYRDLARRLGPDQPVYGFQAQGLDGKQPFLTQIEDMAALYVKELQAVQHEGPYLLGGYCMGGTVALEMAQQLHKQGQDVKLVALFETYNWANGPARSLVDTIYYYIQKLEFNLRNFLLLDSKGKQKFVQEKAKVAKSRSGVWYGMLLTNFSRQIRTRSGQFVPLAQLWEINELAPFHYRPTDYLGPISHFRPVKEYAVNSSPGMDWEKVAKGGVETHILPFYPEGMMLEPFVEQLAEELKDCIDRALYPESINITQSNSSNIYHDFLASTS
jgi:thioesterase domain-containing protein/aryl carrier-like protein